MTETLRRTPLFEEHKNLGAKLVPFGGWEMPISYEGVIAEHHAVRQKCGLFDVSHMGEIFVEGPEAEKFLQWMTVNDLSRLADGQGQYSALLNDQGGIVDDLILYRLRADRFLLCVNASNTEKDFRWIKEHASRFKVNVTDDSARWSQIAVQGPESLATLKGLFSAADATRLAALNYMDIASFPMFGADVFVARTGYTGEQGFELYMPNAVATKIWRELLAQGPKTGVKPIGLGARDTLRLEACYLLYGNDMDDNVSPLEAGIGWAVRLEKDFLAKDRLAAEKARGSSRKMVAFLLDDKGIARPGMDVYSGEKKIGAVTSAGFLPTLDKSGGMALIDASAAKVGDTVEVDIRGKRKLAKIVKRPLYSARVK